MSATIHYLPVKGAKAAPPALGLDQRIALAAKRPENPGKKLDLATLALVRLHAGCAEIAASSLDLGTQKALAVAVMLVLEEYINGVDKI